MSQQQFNVTAEMNRIREQRNMRKRKIYQQSCLKKFRAELVSLHQAGASLRELAIWLRKTKRRRVSHTTIMRYLAKLPELKNSNTNLVNAEKTHAKLS